MLQELNKFDVAYASCYFNLEKYIPAEIYQEYLFWKDKISACLKANKIAKISLITKDQIPQHIYQNYFSSKNEIIQFVKENKLVSKNVLTKFYLKAIYLEKYFDQVKINISDSSYKNNVVHYKFLAGTTFRTNLGPNSFPILNLSKEKRGIILPNNDYLLEIDYNSADLRSIFACLELEQPNTDIYEFLKQKYDLRLERKELKIKTLAWLHSGDFFDGLEKCFDRKYLVDKYYKNGVVTNPFGFEIKCPEEKAVGYLAQSTTSIIFLESLYNLVRYIQRLNLKTKVYFGIHDAVVLDFSKEDEVYKQKFIDIYSQTKFGNFLVKTKTGINYKEML